jgi:acyl-CoA synthetase (AMP-forming)/AMP-acid ligase II
VCAGPSRDGPARVHMDAQPAAPGPTVQTILLQAFRRHAGRACLRWEGGRATYAETGARVTALARHFQETSPADGRIAILLENGREYVETILACTAAGRVRVPLNTREPVETSAKKIDHVESSVLVTTHELWEEVREHLEGDAPAVVLVGAEYDAIAGATASPTALDRVRSDALYRFSFTGGTTGTPKAVVQTHRQELAMIRNILLEVMTPSADEVCVAATPLSHAAGAFVVPVLLGGGSVAWTPRFDPARLVASDWLGDGLGVQAFLVPTALGDVADAAGPDHALRTAVYGGAPCPRPVLERALDRLGPRLVQVYGQAEAPMTICVLGRDEHDDLDAIDGSVGRPFTFVDVAVEDADGALLPVGEVGEVVVRAEHVMSGYWGLAEETAARLRDDGALLTQDLGYVDDAGRVRLVGRGRELIISGGFNVFPDDVERRVGRIDGVEGLTIFAVPHERWGEAVVAAVVAREEGFEEERILDELRGAAGGALAPYERPKRVVAVDELPLTPVGKVSRKALAEQFAHLFDVGDDAA